MNPAPLNSFFVFSLLLFSFIAPLHASAGDRDAQYQQCVQRCTAECPLLPSLPSNHSFPPPSISPVVYAPATPLTPSLRLFQWTCDSNCAYDCMRAHVRWAAAQGWPVLKYHGKWPFVRVWGMQELLSVVFSVGNLLPHAYYALQYRRRVSSRYSLRDWWTAYALISCNTVSTALPLPLLCSRPPLLSLTCRPLLPVYSGCGPRCSTRAMCC